MRESGNKPDYPIPPYVSGSTLDRDQVLSQIGGFSNDERKLFHLLCAIWEAEIPYVKATARAERDHPRLPLALGSLMHRLQQGRVGLLLTTAQDGICNPRALLLTFEGSALFYAKLIEEQWQQVVADPAQALPSRASLAEMDLELPQAVTRPTTMNGFVSMTLSQSPPDHFVAVINLPDSRELLVPSTRAGNVIPALLRKLRHCLDNTSLMSLIAKLNLTNLSDIRRRTESSEATAWRAVVDALLNNRAQLEQSSILLADDLFSSAAIMRRYIEARVELKRRQQLSDRQTGEISKEIEEKVRQAEGCTLSLEDFKAAIREGVPGAEPESRSLHQIVWKRLTAAPADRHLPRVVTLSELALHRDHVFLVLLQRVSHLGELIRKEYVREMQLLLQTSERERFLYFYSFENWEADILQRVEVRDPLVSELLQQRELVAEAVVHSCRTRLHITDPRQIKLSLEVLFEPGGVIPRPYCQLLALDLSGIFEVAYARLGVLKQFVLRLSGRLELMRQRFAEVAAGTGKPGRGAARIRPADVLAQLERGSAEPLDQSAEEEANPAAGGPERRDGGHPRWGGIKARGKKSAPGTVRRPYSRKQQESAWREFEKNIRKKR